jgi:hypothetical protein
LAGADGQRYVWQGPEAAVNFRFDDVLRTLATPAPIRDLSLTSLREKLIKIGAKVISHGRCVAFQMAEVAVPRQLFSGILRFIAKLWPPSDPSPAQTARLS